MYKWESRFCPGDIVEFDGSRYFDSGLPMRVRRIEEIHLANFTVLYKVEGLDKRICESDIVSIYDPAKGRVPTYVDPPMNTG